MAHRPRSRTPGIGTHLVNGGATTCIAGKYIQRETLCSECAFLAIGKRELQTDGM